MIGAGRESALLSRWGPEGNGMRRGEKPGPIHWGFDPAKSTRDAFVVSGGPCGQLGGSAQHPADKGGAPGGRGQQRGRSASLGGNGKF